MSIEDVVIETEILSKEDAENLSFLLSTPQETIPFAREDGIDFSILSVPIEEAKNGYYINAMDVVNNYDANLDVEELEFEVLDAEDGKVRAKVVITSAE